MNYATSEQVTGWIYGTTEHEQPANVAALIRAASALVDQATRGFVYRTDADELPTEARVADAFASAVCEQVQAWVMAGIDPRLGAAQLPRVKASKSALGISVSYADDGGYSASRRLAEGRELTDTALAYLDAINATNAPVGGSGGLYRVPIQARAYDPTRGRLIG